MVGEYGKKGFVVLGITGEGKAPTEKYLEETKADMSVALVSPSIPSMKAFGFRGFPSAALIAPNGKVVWKGHPGGITAKIIEEHIGSVRMSAPSTLAVDVELPRKHAAIQKKLAKGQLGAALKDIDRALERAAQEDGAALGEAKAAVGETLTSLQAAIESASSEGRHADVEHSLDMIAKHFRGHSSADKAKDDLRALKGNTELRNELDAGRTIRKAQKALAEGKKSAAIRTLKALDRGRLADTKEAARGRKLRSEIESGG